MGRISNACSEKENIMKFTLEIDPELNPDAVGEYLRSSFFDEKIIEKKWYGRSNYIPAIRETGCYTTFAWQKDVEELPETCIHSASDLEEYPEFANDKWTRGQKLFHGKYVECRYHWDGDGTLQFVLPSGSILTNDDCKKDHGWDYVTPHKATKET